MATRTYAYCMGPFTKNKKGKQKAKETADSRYIYQNQLGKACFQHDMYSGDFKDLPKRTASDKILRDKAFKIAKGPKCDGCQRRLASIFYKFFDKKTSGGVVKSENNYRNQLLGNLKNKKYTHLLQTILEVLILLICN